MVSRALREVVRRFRPLQQHDEVGRIHAHCRPLHLVARALGRPAVLETLVGRLPPRAGPGLER